MAKKDPIQYKGFTINYIGGEYRADAYANPQFTNTNLAKLKKEINQYLKTESKKTSYAGGGEISVVKSIVYQELGEDNGEKAMYLFSDKIINSHIGGGNYDYKEIASEIIYEYKNTSEEEKKSIYQQYDLEYKIGDYVDFKGKKYQVIDIVWDNGNNTFNNPYGYWRYRIKSDNSSKEYDYGVGVGNPNIKSISTYADGGGIKGKYRISISENGKFIGEAKGDFNTMREVRKAYIILVLGDFKPPKYKVSVSIPSDRFRKVPTDSWYSEIKDIVGDNRVTKTLSEKWINKGSASYAGGGEILEVEGGHIDLSPKEKVSIYKWIENSPIFTADIESNEYNDFDLQKELSKKFDKTDEQSKSIIKGWEISRGYSKSKGGSTYAGGGEIMFGSKWIKKGASPKTIYNIDNIDGDRIYFHSSRGTHYQRTRENFLKDYSKKGGSMARGGEINNGNLKYDLRGKLLNYDEESTISSDEIEDLMPQGYVLDIGEESYFYYDEETRDSDKKIAKEILESRYAKGGGLGLKTYEIKGVDVTYSEDSYEEGELEDFHSYMLNQSEFPYQTTFDSKKELFDTLNEFISYADFKEDDFYVDENTIQVSAIVKYEKDSDWDEFSAPTKEEIELWKQGKMKLYSAQFVFSYEVYRKEKLDFAKGGSTYAEGGEIKVGSKVTSDVSGKNIATVVEVKKGIKGFNGNTFDMVHIEWKDKTKGNMSWAGRPEKFKSASKDNYAEGGEVEGYNMDEVVKHFVMAGLWASNDDEGEPFEDSYDADDVSKESYEKIAKGAAKFINENKALLKKHNISTESLGHDLFLDSQGHGVGFWDRGYGDDGDTLSKSASKIFASDQPYVGDDKKIYFKKGGSIKSSWFSGELSFLNW